MWQFLRKNTWGWHLPPSAHTCADTHVLCTHVHRHTCTLHTNAQAHMLSAYTYTGTQALWTHMLRHICSLHTHVQEHTLPLTRKVKKMKEKKKKEHFVLAYNFGIQSVITWTYCLNLKHHSMSRQIEGFHSFYDKQKKKRGTGDGVSIYFKDMPRTDPHLPRLYRDQCTADHGPSNHGPWMTCKIKTPPAGVQHTHIKAGMG